MKMGNNRRGTIVGEVEGDVWKSLACKEIKFSQLIFYCVRQQVSERMELIRGIYIKVRWNINNENV